MLMILLAIVLFPLAVVLGGYLVIGFIKAFFDGLSG